MPRSRPRALDQSRREFIGFVVGQGKLGQATHVSKIDDTRTVTMRRHNRHLLVVGCRIRSLAAGSTRCASSPDQASTAARRNTAPKGFRLSRGCSLSSTRRTHPRLTRGPRRDSCKWCGQPLLQEARPVSRVQLPLQAPQLSRLIRNRRYPGSS